MLIQKLASIAEENVEDAEPASCQVEDPDGIQDFSTAAEEFRILGALVDEAGVTVRPRPKSFLKPMRSKRIPAGCRGLGSCRVPEDKTDWWMVSTAGRVLEPRRGMDLSSMCTNSNSRCCSCPCNKLGRLCPRMEKDQRIMECYGS